MARYTLVYGIRLVPEGTLDGAEDARLKLQNGTEAGLTLPTIDGTVPQLRRALDRSLDAFFDLLPGAEDEDREDQGLPFARGVCVADSSVPTSPEKDRVQVNQGPPYRELNDRIVGELIDAVKGILRKEQSDRLRDIYLIGDIEKDTARGVIERLRELANDNHRPVTLYINSAGGNVTDGLAIHDAIREVVGRNIEVTIVVQGMAYSMGSVVLQAASTGRRL